MVDTGYVPQEPRKKGAAVSAKRCRQHTLLGLSTQPAITWIFNICCVNHWLFFCFFFLFAFFFPLCFCEKQCAEMLRTVYFREADSYSGGHPPHSLQLSDLPTFLSLFIEISGTFWAFQFADFHIKISGNEGVGESPGVWSQIFQPIHMHSSGRRIY